MKEKFTFQQKTKLLTKLFDAGCNTEKKLQQLPACLILQKQSMRSWKKERLNTINNRQQLRTAKKMSRPELL